MINVWHHANNVVAQMPRHQRILAPTTTAVTLTLNAGAKVICGCLWPYLSNGDLGNRLKKANEDRVRLPLELKKRWCLQIVEAVNHTHRVAYTYHMDINSASAQLVGSCCCTLLLARTTTTSIAPTPGGNCIARSWEAG
ncbi:unnamed protein product [Cercospora beticola]|nr:unnamed protein product [Cercospora beticola]